MEGNSTARRRQPTPAMTAPRSAILELGDQLDELWRRFREAQDAFDVVDQQRSDFVAANIPAALTQRPGDDGLFHAAFYPGAGMFYLDEAIDRLGDALSSPNCKAKELARYRVQNMLAAREAWQQKLEAFEASVGLAELRRASDEAFNELFGALDRLRDMPATTLEELRVKARQWNEQAGHCHSARDWNNAAQRPEGDDCMLGSLLADLIGDIGQHPVAA